MNARYFRRFVASLVACLGFLWLIISLTDWCFSVKLLSNSSYNGFLILSFISLLYSMGDTIFVLSKELQTKSLLNFSEESDSQILPKEDLLLVDTLFLDLRIAFDQEKWQEVIKIGSVLSRPLWITGKYDLRIQIGKLVEAAAAYCNDAEKQASTLIDDLGWTYVALKELEKAKKNIKHGLRIARKNGNYYIACKATRHLSGIYLRESKLTLAKKYSDDAKKYITQLKDSKSKKEMQAGLHYLDAVIFKNEKQYDDSLRELKNAMVVYESEKDNDRYSKCLSLKGHILLEKGDFNTAKDIFRKGLAFSKKISRQDQVIENYLGLGMVYKYENDFNEAMRAFQHAFQVAEMIGNKILANEIKQKYLEKGE